MFADCWRSSELLDLGIIDMIHQAAQAKENPELLKQIKLFEAGVDADLHKVSQIEYRFWVLTQVHACNTAQHQPRPW